MAEKSIPLSGEARSGRTLAKHLSLLALYVFLSIIATYPLALNFATSAPGDITDAPALTWNLWWIKFSIIDRSANPLFTNFVFYPIGIDLIAYTLTLWNGFIALPITFISNFVAANNFIVLMELTLAAYGMYLLAYDRLLREQLDTRAAIFAGFIYGLGSYHLNYIARGQPNIAANQWVPFFFFFLIRGLESRRAVRHGVLAAIFFAMSAWTELTYAAFLGLLTVIYLMLQAPSSYRQCLFPASNKTQTTKRQRIFSATRLIYQCLGGKFALILGAGVALALAPILWDIARETARYGDYWTVGLGRTPIFSGDLLGFVLPSSLNPLFGFLTRHLAFQTFNWTFVGLVPAALGVYAFVAFRAPRIWGWLAVIFAILMLGPFLQIAGNISSIPLPFGLFAYVPFLKSNRYPFRLNSFLMLALALIASYALAALVTRPRGRIVAVAIIAFAFVEQLTVPMGLTDLRIPAVFNVIRSDPGDFAVLDLPLGWRDSARILGAVDYRAHFWQTAHQKRLLDGNTSRNPDWKFQYFLQAPILNSIIALENGHDLDDTRRAQDLQLAREVLQFYNIRYINAYLPRTDDKVLQYVTTIIPATEIYRDGERIVYRVAAQAPGRGTIDQLSETASMYFDDGWGRAQVAAEGFGYRWADQADARMWLPLSQDQYQVKVKLRAAASSQRVSVSVNGKLTQTLVVNDSWADYVLDIPSSVGREGLNDLVFTTSLMPVGATRQDNYSIGDTTIVSPVDISVTAAGFDAGRFGEIFVDGKDMIDGRRGYALVALDAHTGAVLHADRFDTFADPNESMRLARFVADLPRGTLVAGAAVDDVSKELKQEAIDALHELGVESDLRYQFRTSHAFIGVKGAKMGQALESVDAHLPANVSVGKNVESARVAFALGTVTWDAEK